MPTAKQLISINNHICRVVYKKVDMTFSLVYHV